MSAPDAGGLLGSDEFLAELRWTLAQVAFLLHLEGCSEDRLDEVRERVNLLGGKARCVLLSDEELRTRLVAELDLAAEALESIHEVQKKEARQRIKAVEDRLSAALVAFGRGPAGGSSSL